MLACLFIHSKKKIRSGCFHKLASTETRSELTLSSHHAGMSACITVLRD